MNKIVIAGGRDFTDYDYLAESMVHVLNAAPHSTYADDCIVISGGAKGADQLGEWFCHEHLYKEPILYKADWEKHGKMAGPMRNTEMAKAADYVVCFWDGKSRGTRDMISKAIRFNKPLWVFHYEGDSA